MNLAVQGKLKNTVVLEREVRLMLSDARSQELVKNFAGQWLQLRTMQSSTPEGDLAVRRGLLGKGAIQLVTSISDRTSPVQRGKWVLMNILGTIPPEPPPNVPALKPTGEKLIDEQTMRQRMEEHRANPACASCHKMMDPIGFALENFDGIGKWRTTEAGQKLDSAGQLVDGTKIDSVSNCSSSNRPQVSLRRPFHRIFPWTRTRMGLLSRSPSIT